MPNFKLGSGIRAEIIAAATCITVKRVQYAEAKFPLTTAGIQAAIMTPDHVRTMHRLKDDGIEGLPKANDIAVRLSKDYLPGLERDCDVGVYLPESIYVPRRTRGHFYNTELDSTRDVLRLDTGELNDEDRAAIAAWANKAVKENRIANMVDWTVKRVMDATTSSAMLLSWFPLLATLTSDTFWVKRFRVPPKNHTRWMPNPALVELYAKPIQIAEVILTGGQMLANFKHEENTVRASIGAWERKATDPRT